jgi:hypothetical protein
MEAVLDFGRGCQDLAIILVGVWGRGGAEIERRSAPLLSHLKGGVRGGGGGQGGERESKYVLALNAAMCT